MWGQFQGGPEHPGTIVGAPAPPYKEAWRFHPPDAKASGAVIVGDVAITVGSHAVYGLDLATGMIRWQLFRNGGPIAMPAVGVAGGTSVLVFPDETLGAQASLVGVDLSSMREIWRTPLEAASRSAVAVDGNMAVASDEDGNVYGVKIDSGVVAWTAKLGGTIDAAAAVSDGKVFVVIRDASGQQVVRLVALDESDGKQLWDFTPRIAGATASGPAASGGAAVIGSADRNVRSVGPDGQERWVSLALSLFSPVSAPALTGGDVYIADASGGLYRIDASTGARIWDYQLNELVVRSSPVVAGNVALIGLNDGRLVAVDVGSSDLVWQSAADAGLIGAIALSPQAIVAVKGGSQGGLVEFVHDDAGTLVNIPSPTKVDAGKLFGNYAVALIGATLILFASFRLLSARFAPVAIARQGAADEIQVDDQTDDGDEDEDER